MDPGKLCAAADLGSEETRPREEKPRGAHCCPHGPRPLSPGNRHRAEGRVSHEEGTWNSHFRWSVGEETPNPGLSQTSPWCGGRHPEPCRGNLPARKTRALGVAVTPLSCLQDQQS